MEGLGIKTNFENGGRILSDSPAILSPSKYSDGKSTNNKETITSINTNNDDYSYEYYDLDNNHIINNQPYGDDDYDDDDANSIQASPVDIAPRKNLSGQGSLRQPSGLASHPQINGNGDGHAPPNITTSPVRQPSAQTSSPHSINTNGSSLPNSDSHDKNLSAVAKVRNMFPGFGSYKALNKSSTTQIGQPTGPYTYSNDSTTSVAEEPHPPRENHQQPKFTEVDLDPSFKPQVIQVNNRPDSDTISPYLDPNRKEDEANLQLLHSRNNTESLDFVPNMRPNIDMIGSRLRTPGVPSPATLIMTKSQYDKYRQTKDDKGEDNGEDSDEDQDEEDDDDDDENPQKARARRVFEEDEAKKEDFRMRMKQDAHLSVYRQKMTKLTGSQIGLSNLNPGVLSSSSNLPSGDDGFDYDSDEDYDDVPLGILKAHGFPTSGRLKTMKSQHNFGEEPNLMLPQPGGFGRQAGETASLRSFQSNLAGPPAVAPELEEGYLAMRNHNLSNIPGFNSSVPMNRGLVGEIAREEVAKRSRKAQMNNLAAQRTATMNGSMFDVNDGGSIYNGAQNNSSSSSGNGGGNSGEIQLQLQQMMQMQTQILQQMASNQGSPMTMLSTPGRMTPMQQGAPMKKMWSSFDVMSHGLRPGGAPSIRSFAQSDNHSIRSFPVNQAQQQQPINARPPLHQPHNSMPTLEGFKFPSTSPQPGGMPQQHQTNSMIMPGAGPNGANHQKQGSVATARLVDVGGDDDDDDDDDDEAGWKEMEQRKEQLRRLWKTQPAVVL
ncbi:hypothetical protein DV451_001739 [Geotrichum candidum]|uniref:Uncharacterized protein n=1 Tax=Geotrichum candidum TaxID=1173061 RepID=A0A9P5KU59_GEOCN|nr:hypothetical protein DV451_001739 [Geotrichum candidum]KAF5107169.1 hypothetical protein DV453_003339 [Geotrichum candidum]